MRGGKTAFAVIIFETAMIVAWAGSYVGAQTMGEYGSTMDSTGVAAEQQGGSGELAGAPETTSPIDRPSALDSGNDPLSEAPSYFGDSGNGSGSMTGSEDTMGGEGATGGEPSQDSSGVPYAPSVP